MRYVVKTGIEMLPHSDELPFPTAQVRAKDRQRVLQLGPRKLSDKSKSNILAEIASRKMLDYEESNTLVLGADFVAEEEED